MVYERIPTNNWNWLVFHPPRNTLNNQGPFCHCSSFYSWRSPLQPLISGHVFFLTSQKGHQQNCQELLFCGWRIFCQNLILDQGRSSFLLGVSSPPLPFQDCCFVKRKNATKMPFSFVEVSGVWFFLDIQKPPNVFPDTIFWVSFFLSHTIHVWYIYLHLP